MIIRLLLDYRDYALRLMAYSLWWFCEIALYALAPGVRSCYALCMCRFYEIAFIRLLFISG